jgi:hypothetical protein
MPGKTQNEEKNEANSRDVNLYIPLWMDPEPTRLGQVHRQVLRNLNYAKVPEGLNQDSKPRENHSAKCQRNIDG